MTDLPPCLRPQPAALAREPELAGVAWDERHLQCIWADSRLRPKHLFTTGGTEVRVIEAGRWNRGPGPDFNGATVEINGVRRHGSVEVHVRPGDWFLHGHDSDPRYGEVVLHLCWFPPSGGENAPEIPLVPLRDAMLERPCFSFDQIDPTAYPVRAADVPIRPCRAALAGLGTDAVGEWLEKAGRARLRRKAGELSKAIDAASSPLQAFYEALMAALGYRRNAGAMRALATRVTAADLAVLADAKTRYAALLAAAGLLPGEASPGIPSDWIAENWSAAFRAGVSYSPESARGWVLSGLRPANHPRARLAAAAALFESGGAPLLSALESVPREKPKSWLRETVEIIADKAAIGRELLPPRLARIGTPLGKNRIMAMLANVIIPWFARNDDCAWRLMEVLPGEDLGANGREMALRLLGPDHNPAKLYASRTLRLQGLLELWNGYCAASEEACETCPLAAMARQAMSER